MHIVHLLVETKLDEFFAFVEEKKEGEPDPRQIPPESKAKIKSLVEEGMMAMFRDIEPQTVLEGDTLAEVLMMTTGMSFVAASLQEALLTLAGQSVAAMEVEDA